MALHCNKIRDLVHCTDIVLICWLVWRSADRLQLKENEERPHALRLVNDTFAIDFSAPTPRAQPGGGNNRRPGTNQRGITKNSGAGESSMVSINSFGFEAVLPQVDFNQFIALIINCENGPYQTDCS